MVVWERKQWGTPWLRRMLWQGVEPDIRPDADVSFAAQGSWHGPAGEGEEEWVHGELEKGTLEEWSGRVPTRLARVFCIKKLHKTRWIVNYKWGLNQWTHTPRFRVVRLGQIADAIEKGDWGAVLDIRSAFKHVGIAPWARRWFAFRAGGKVLVPTVLPFGWAGSPWWWNRITKVLEAALKEAGVRAVVYVDDVLVLGASREETKAAMATCRQVLGDMGLVIAENKVTAPSQLVTYLGYKIDLATNTWEARKEDRAEIRKMASRLLGARWGSRKLVFGLLGKIQGRRMALEQINAHTGELYALVRRRRGPWSKGIALPERVRGELKYWASLKAHQARSRWIKDEARWTATSDASHRGWGVVLTDTRTGQEWVWSGFWSKADARRHITALESIAILRGLEAMAVLGFREAVVRWQADNKAAVATVTKLRSRSRELQDVARQMAGVLRAQQLRVRASYLSGKLNVRADYHSRDGLADLIDHKVRRDVFRWLRWGRGLEIDMFASRTSRMLWRFCSAVPDRKAVATDALAQEWRECGSMWMHPPWGLLSIVVRKLAAERSEATVLAPRWPSATWWDDWWQATAEVWILPRVPLLIHAETRRMMPAARGRYMLGFFGTSTIWLRHRGAVIEGLSTLLSGHIEIWVKTNGSWQRSPH